MPKKKPPNPLDHPCPHCDAQPEQPCVSRLSGRRAPTHLARRDPTSHRLTRQHHQGRPPATLTPDLTDTICTNLRLGAPLNMATQAAGISIATVYRWLAEADTEDPNTPDTPLRDFREAVTRARAQGGIVQLGRINQAAQRHLKSEEPLTYTDEKGKVRPVLDGQGNPVVKRVWEMDWRASAFVLERSFARDFGRRQVVELSAADGVEPAVGGGGVSDEAGVVDLASRVARFRARKELEAEQQGALEGRVTNR